MTKTEAKIKMAGVEAAPHPAGQVELALELLETEINVAINLSSSVEGRIERILRNEEDEESEVEQAFPPRVNLAEKMCCLEYKVKLISAKLRSILGRCEL